MIPATGWDQCSRQKPQAIRPSHIRKAAFAAQRQTISAPTEAGRISGASLREWMKAPAESSIIAMR